MSSPYSPLVLEHFLAPRGTGRLAPGPDVHTGQAGERRLGAEVIVSLRHSGGRIVDLRCQVYGCPYLIAAASCLAEAARGAALEEIARWQWRATAERLDVPVTRYGRLLVLEDALKACLATLPPLTPG